MNCCDPAASFGERRDKIKYERDRGKGKHPLILIVCCPACRYPFLISVLTSRQHILGLDILLPFPYVPCSLSLLQPFNYRKAESVSAS
jgi:hypothetical protein